jgi:hypothetical protein
MAGDRVSAADWNTLCDRVEHADRLSVGPGLEMIDGPSGRMLGVNLPRIADVFYCNEIMSGASQVADWNSDSGKLYDWGDQTAIPFGRKSGSLQFTQFLKRDEGEWHLQPVSEQCTLLNRTHCVRSGGGAI